MPVRRDTLGPLYARCWNQRRWLMWLPLVILLLPLAFGQGWIGEVVMTMQPFIAPAHGVAYFLVPTVEDSRIFNGLPFAVALLTPWPEWSVAALIVLSWLLTAGTTYAIVARLLPGDAKTALLAFFVAGTTAYDIALLHASYLPLVLAALLHWAGFLAMLVYCEKRAPAVLVMSSALQFVSLFMYGTAIAAIAVGPIVAFAILAREHGPRAAVRPVAAIALAWWAPLLAYLGALAWVAMQPGNYLTTIGLHAEPSARIAWLFVRLLAKNFDPTDWLNPAPYFSDPPRLVGRAAVWQLAILASALMVLLLAGAERARGATARTDRMRWIWAALLLCVVVSNLATTPLQSAYLGMRTHLVSRLYAAILIAVACTTLLASRNAGVRAAAALLTVACLAVGAWTVADRGSYLASIWPRHRTELRSLDALVRKIDPKAVVILFEPPGAGYTATVAPWHALPWLMIIRGSANPPAQFALWSPDRDANCAVAGAELRCDGDMQAPVRVPLDRLVLLRYDKTNCGFHLVEDEWVGPSPQSPPPGYAPRQWLLDQPAATASLFQRLVYGPQGLGGEIPCR
jgi:hypothetical protein